MTLTRERSVQERTRRPVSVERIEIPASWRLPTPPRPSLRDRVAASLASPIPPARAIGLWLGWLALFGVALAVEPAPADPQAAASAYEILLLGAFLGAMGAMFMGLARQRRWGVVAAVVASGLLVFGSVACIVSGHHPYGTWWLVQTGAAGGALGLSVGALRRD
jgi:peptidoglycan/LPS O-acetylase OafA/YrhL